MINSLGFMAYIENYQCAFIILDFKAKRILYVNRLAIELYNITLDTEDLEPIFSKNKRTLIEMFTKDMKEGKGDELITDVVTLKSNGEMQMVDLHLGYFSKENNQAYVEIMPKTASPLKAMKRMIDDSSKATFILNLDNELTVEYCSENTKKKYKVEEGARFTQGFRPSQKEILVKEIKTNFISRDNDSFYKHIQLVNKNNERIWYAVSLDRIKISNENIKLICNLICIEEQVSMQNELDNVSQYFNILQSMTKGLLYRFDIRNKTLYRDEETAKTYGIPPVVKNYPNCDNLSDVIFIDDIEEYISFINYIAQGGEGSHTVRMMTPSRKYEYHKVTFKALKYSDGSLKEMVGMAVNINDLKETEKALDTTNQYFDILQSFSNDLLYRFDIENKILYRNQNSSNYYGIPPVVENYPNFESLNGVFHKEDIDNYVKYINQVIDTKEGSHTARMISPSGNFEYHKFTFKKLKNKDGTVKEMVGHAVNIHNLMELETKASYDMLTDCLNKISFNEQVVEILKNSNISNRHALFFIDLDDFKGINDNLGHTFGDYLLQTVGSRLQKLVRGDDLVGRVGGDEFVIFMDSCGDDLHVERRGNQILEALRKEFLQNSICANIKCSVGAAIYPVHGTTFEELYENADKALYHSKKLGKDVSTIYYKGMD